MIVLPSTAAFRLSDCQPGRWARLSGPIRMRMNALPSDSRVRPPGGGSGIGHRGFLALDQPVSEIDVILCGTRRGRTRRNDIRIRTSPRNHAGVHPKQAAVGVQQVLLVGDQSISHFNVALRLGRRDRREQQCHQCD